MCPRNAPDEGPSTKLRNVPVSANRTDKAHQRASGRGRFMGRKALGQPVDDLRDGVTLVRIRQWPNLRGIVMESSLTHGRTRAGTHP
ncbi:hypothetical protein [Synechococcus sp. UW140]|uniref:hypothetical protein n=1 Tax=Synechococcus sp. UW140 TaxID=368503 RepID=UPI000E0E5A69|nr:hypothetical protein [Synechococcus sp. UW140]